MSFNFQKYFPKKLRQKIDIFKQFRNLIDSGKVPPPELKEDKLAGTKLQKQLQKQLSYNHRFEANEDTDPTQQFIINKHKNEESPFHPF